MTGEADFSAEDQKALDAMRAEAERPAQETPAVEAPQPAAETAVTQPRTEAQPERQEQPRDDKGKFAAPEKAAEQPKPEEPKHVPLAALQEERDKRQSLKAEFDQYRGTIEERLKQLQDRIKPAEQPKSIDVDAQPLEALKETRQQLQQVQQAQQVAFQRQQFAQHVAAQVQDYKGKTDDYDAAYKYLRDGRVAELSAMGFNPTQIAQQLEQDEFGISAMALQSGENPGARLYKIAEARGYKKATPVAQPQPQAQPQQPSALERLAAAEAGQKAAKSLGAPGAAPAATLKMEDLASMPPDKLAALSDDDFRRIMGG